MNMKAFAQLSHNGRLIDQAKNNLQSAVEAGISIYFENPDGAMLKLEEGFKLHNLEMVWDITYKSDDKLVGGVK